MYVKLVGKTEGCYKYSDLNPEEMVAAIARHGVIKEDNGKLVKYLMDHKHWSPLDMVDFLFEIETSRAIGRQMIRHKGLWIQEHSQRYSDKLKFEDVELRKEHPNNRQSSTEVIEAGNYGERDPYYFLHEVLSAIEYAYKSMLALGVAKECARMILPECTSTVMTFKGSVRSWLSFLNVRCDEHSQKEIQEVATLVGEQLEAYMPGVMGRVNWREGMFM